MDVKEEVLEIEKCKLVIGNNPLEEGVIFSGFVFDTVPDSIRVEEGESLGKKSVKGHWMLLLIIFLLTFLFLLSINSQRLNVRHGNCQYILNESEIWCPDVELYELPTSDSSSLITHIHITGDVFGEVLSLEVEEEEEEVVSLGEEVITEEELEGEELLDEEEFEQEGEGKQESEPEELSVTEGLMIVLSIVVIALSVTWLCGRTKVAANSEEVEVSFSEELDQEIEGVEISFSQEPHQEMEDVPSDSVPSDSVPLDSVGMQWIHRRRRSRRNWRPLTSYSNMSATSYGSFTTLEMVPRRRKDGVEDLMMVPVRRSKRLKSKGEVSWRAK